MKSRKILSLLTTGIALGSSAFGQISFDPFNGSVDGWINPFLPGLENKLQADITTTLIDTNSDSEGLYDTIRVSITNIDTDPGDVNWDVSSDLTGFFLLKPVLNGARINPTSSSLGSWTEQTSLTDSLKAYGGLSISETSNYFGAIAPGGDAGLENGENMVFDFFFGDYTFSDSNYSIIGDPTAMVRWQTVRYVSIDDGYDYNFFNANESGKGGAGPDFNPVIPEPSELAFLGILGMGALLYGRRRFMKNAN